MCRQFLVIETFHSILSFSEEKNCNHQLWGFETNTASVVAQNAVSEVSGYLKVNVEVVCAR
jgi:hypothetical protein